MQTLTIHWAALIFVLYASLHVSAEAPSRIAIGAATAPAGATAMLQATFTGEPTQTPSVVLVRLSYLPDQLQIVDIVAPEALASAGKSVDYEIEDGALALAVYGGDTPIPDGVLAHILLTVAPDIAPGALATFGDADTHGAASDASQRQVHVSAAPLEVIAAGAHSADTAQDWRISLPELLRIIQLYNEGAYHCDASGPDGYAPGFGPQDCPAHDADYTPQDWRISFEELLRIIQLYNAPHGVYHQDTASEDGYAPGPFGFESNFKIEHGKRAPDRR